MHSAIVIGCGGPGCNIVSRVRDSTDLPTMTVNWTDADVEILPPEMAENEVHGNAELAAKCLEAKRNEILLNIDGYSEIILVTALGGGLGSAAVEFISKCARLADSKLIAAIVIPFKFEDERRAHTLRDAFGMEELADRILLMDNQRFIETGGTEYVANDALGAVEDMLKDAVVELARLLDTVPFFSTLTQKSYSFSHDDAGSLEESVMSAADHPMFDVDPGNGKLIICCDAAISDIEAERVCSNVTDHTGIRPEIISGTEPKGHGVTVFIPISRRSSQ
ncbi:Cell division GTPase [Thermoplasmatales archaeon BRNA1]|nr:Cell division GTPase [Thermoplasmatales archaeon BRNA1]